MRKRNKFGRHYRREMRKLVSGTVAKLITQYERRFYIMTVIAAVEAAGLILLTILFLGAMK